MGLFFDPINKRYTITQEFPHLFRPEFPVPAMCLVSGITKHIFRSCRNGRIVGTGTENKLNDVSRSYVDEFIQKASEQRAKPLYKMQIDRELRRLSERGFQQLASIQAVRASSSVATSSDAGENRSLQDVFGDHPINLDNVNWGT